MESSYTASICSTWAVLFQITQKYHIHFSFYDFTHSSSTQCLPFPLSLTKSLTPDLSRSQIIPITAHSSGIFPATEFLKLYCLHKFSLMFLLISSLPLEHPSPLGRESADSGSKNSVCTNSVQTVNRVKGSRSFCCWMINRTKSWVPTNFQFSQL